MITRLRASNFRCLVAFEAKFESFGGERDISRLAGLATGRVARL